MYSNVIFFGGAALALLIGLVYLRKATSEAPLIRRIAASSYGPAIAVVYFVAVFAWPERLQYTATGLQVYYAIQAIPVILLFYSLRAYPGPRAVHFALVPLAVFGLGKNEWVAYRESIVDYRNQIVAHHDLNATVAKTPQFDVALTAAAFMFEKLRKFADPDLLGGIPTDLPQWSATVAKNMAAIVTQAFAASVTLGSNIAITNAKAAE